MLVLKKIEAELGRDFNAIRNGPRVIDLDILFYDNIILDTPDLVIPHPRLAEREFVLRPLCE
jgi:2-amino-4-hydroxy-6-hydroxymethyldihydropteridine diphosphokinase